MKRNPLIPFLLIAIMGIGLVFFLSMKGLHDQKEIAGKDNKTAEENKAAASPEEIYKQNCVSCHGENYEGVSGPKLKGVGERLDTAKIKEKIQKGGNGMPAGLVPAEKLDEMAKWLSKIK
ncbi:cytochrome c [Bacillus sp. CLL-7-23]|uniref:Cytochrome c n=1 Tax=Bacillus changyiensis TaxID=3004103 RepID=A0ABT4X3P5_9BACI|nr:MULTISPECIES: cytochrome c [Bacillus]MDA1474809.1 cytochrome c [Bacillus changyiensis]MDA7026913.1 cytochrome c [Bacillus changyiensis]NPC93343.1 cytochrome c [Bacillus sp. WMMC1349]